MRDSKFLRHHGCLLLLCLLPWHHGTAMDLDQAEAMALARDAGLNTLLHRREALQQQAVADAALPDPEFILGAQGVPIDDPLGADMMTMYMLGLRQQFPSGDSRRLSGQRSLSEADALHHQAQARRLDIQRQVRRAWLVWAGTALATEAAETGLDALSEMLALTEARYRSGTGRQRDVDQARLERSLMARRILDLETRRAEAAAELARWTGQLPPSLPAAGLPEWPELMDEVSSPVYWLSHPVIETESQRIESSRLATDLARQAYRPMWMVEAGYAHQRGRNPMTLSRQSDKLFAMVSVSLPLFTANRQDRRLAAAQAEQDAMVDQRQQRLQEWEGRIRGQLTSLERQQRRLELLDDIILPEAEQTLASTLTAYRNDRASFDELIRARLAQIDQRLELIETRIQWSIARIELAYLIAEDLP
jgi:outer membrane protein, heavy metal efflux system